MTRSAGSLALSEEEARHERCHPVPPGDVMNRPQALRLRVRAPRNPEAPAAAPQAEEPVATATPAPAGGRRARGREAAKPRTGYDDLTTEQVIAHISRLTPPDLVLLDAHERAHQNRPEVLARIAAFQGHGADET
jgi:hypothetical protein